MASNPLDEVFPVGELLPDWNYDSYWRGPTGRNGRTHALAAFRHFDFCDDVEPVWVVALERCPDYPSEEDRNDGDFGCCGGECEGGSVWRVVKDRVPGARRAWRWV